MSLVIPRSAEHQEIAQRREGRLSEVPFAALLYSHFRSERSTALELKRGPVTKRISLEAGVPVDCRSNLAHETLGRFLVTAGKLSDEDFHSSLALSAAREVPLGEILLERGLIGAEELFRYLQQNLAKKLLDLFTWTDGEFRVVDERLTTDSSLRVRVPQLVLTGIVRFAPPEQVSAAVAPMVGKILSLAPESAELLAELKLSEAQARLSVALRPGLRIDQLAEATRLPYEEISRDLYALALLGVMTAGDRPPARPTAPIPIPKAAVASTLAGSSAAAEAPPHSRPDERPAPAATKSPEGAADRALAAPPPPAVTEKRRDELMQLYLAHRRLDPFDLLGVPEEAPQRAIEGRFVELAERCAPWTFAGDLEEKAREVFLAAARAFGQLADSTQRSELAFRRRSQREERARRPVELPRIKTDLLDTEVQFKKAMAHVEAERYREAVQLLEFTSDCDPSNGLYRAELARARFRLAPPSAARQSARDLKEALRIDPKCGLAAYYLGEIEGHLGHREEAEEAFRLAIRLMAPDRRPIEALKALQAQKKR